MKIGVGHFLAATSAILIGCATPPQGPVSLIKEAVGSQAGRVGVMMTALPQQGTATPGADCLLCLATASMMNSTLTSHARALSYEDLPNLKGLLADVLRKKGTNVVVLDGVLELDALPKREGTGENVARVDFSSLQAKYNIDRLLVLDITSLGFVRTYSAYVPTSDPKATLNGKGYLVELRTNNYDWYQQISVTRSAGQVWDEPPTFPGLTNAYYQVLELGKESFLEPFLSVSTTTQASIALGQPARVAAGGSTPATEAK